MTHTMRRQSPYLTLGLVVSSMTLIALLAGVFWVHPAIVILVASQLLLYTGLHELSHGIAASLWGIPVETITIGPTGLSRPLFSIGQTNVRISWLPIGVTLHFGWARLTRPRQIALGISGALVPLMTWSVAGWTWHVILLTGLLSWIPGMADGRLLFPHRPSIERLDALRDGTHALAITEFQVMSPTLHRIVVDGDPRPIDRRCCVEFVSKNRRWQRAVTVLPVGDNPRVLLVRSQGPAYPVDRRHVHRRAVRIRGILRTPETESPILTHNMSRTDTRLSTTFALPTDALIAVQFQWKSLCWTRSARILRCRQESQNSWDVVALWSSKPAG